MSETVRVVRVGEKSSTTVVRVESHQSSGAVVIPVGAGHVTGDGERWWQGEGPPPELIVGARTGDWYWDTVTGDVYELNEGA